MEQGERNSYVAAFLGVILGIMIVVLYNSITDGRRKKVSYHDWRKLNVVLEQVEQNYVDTVDSKAMTDAAIVAALAKLDPHTIYLPPAQLEDSETDLAGNFDGIGIQFNVPNDTAMVIEVIPGGPAEKAGMLQGDRLLMIDSVNVAGVNFPQDSMVRRMKGPSGTKVVVTVGRGSEVIPFTITRGKIPVHCVDASFMVDDTTGYIRLSKFSRTTYQEVLMASMSLLAQDMKHLVLDLRDNTGGYLDQALALADMFLDKNDEIVYLMGRNRKKEDYKASGKGIMRDVAVSVIINESSASSSEILAGAIQDNDRGMIVGRRSFGKGLVQEPVYFTDGSGIRVTVARFYTPSGRCIQKPYSDDYSYDIYKRYADGEMFASDSIKIDSTAAFKTVGGRTVYGGGGIVPDIFVPMDTTKATKFYIACNRKATSMRFASAMFDKYKGRLADIDDYAELDRFLDSIDLPSQFLTYAASKDGIRPETSAEWQESAAYMMPQIRALVARYSKLGDNAFYKMYIGTDREIKAAMESPSRPVLPVEPYVFSSR